MPRTQNAWTDTDLDTRNVAVHEFVVEVMDVQDTAPFFLSAPPITVLPETATVVSEQFTLQKKFVLFTRDM